MRNEIETLVEKAAQARKKQSFIEAKRDLEQALEICRATGTQRDLARTLKALGQIERDLDQAEIALRLYEQATAICRKEGDALALAHTIRHVADIQQELGRGDVAEINYREALSIYRALPDVSKLDLANAVRGLAILVSESARSEEAKLLWQEAKGLYGALNLEAGIKESASRLALLASAEPRQTKQSPL